MRNPLHLCILLLAVAISACQPTSAGNDTEFPTVAEFEPKTPKLPTLFVDTSGKTYPWIKLYNVVHSIRERIDTPAGYERMKTEDGSFGRWLSMMPLKPGHPDVMLFDNSPKGRQDVHHAVINMDVGDRDLQQCADAVMRVRAEYLYSQQLDEQINFNFTSGAPCPWNKWKQGLRPEIVGDKVNWKAGGTVGRTYPNFKSYLNKVFTYAGTASLAKQMKAVSNPKEVEIGDVFIKGGFPGHAVIVMDVAVHKETGERLFLLAQSYMPAQEMHILKNPDDTELSPWYRSKSGGTLETPEWDFDYARELKRF